MDPANRRPDPIPFYGELGSNNPVFVTRDAVQARGEEIAAGFLESITLGSLSAADGVGVLNTLPAEADSPAPVLLSVSLERVLADPRTLEEECFGPAGRIRTRRCPD